MNFKQLLSFVTVANCESFAKASEHLGLSQQTVSAHVRMLDLKNLVESGCGVSIASYRAVAHNVAEGKMVQFDIPDSLASRNLYVAYRPDSLMNCERDFLNFLRFKYAEK